MNEEKKKKDNVIGIGHNTNQYSINVYANLTEHVKAIGKKLWKLNSAISQAKDTHTASHGDKYYFKDELRCPERSVSFYEANGLSSKGVERRPNPYEKKEFAGATTNKLDDTSEQIVKLAMEVNELEKKLEESNDSN